MQLFQNLSLRLYRKGDYLFRKNDPLAQKDGTITGHAYVILQGEVLFYNEVRVNFIAHEDVKKKMGAHLLKKLRAIEQRHQAYALGKTSIFGSAFADLKALHDRDGEGLDASALYDQVLQLR